MEMINNTVNISLEKYNELNQQLINKENRLKEVQEQLIDTRARLNQVKENKIIVYEKQLNDRWGGNYKSETLKFDINDPDASKTLLDIISKVDNSELSNTIKTQIEEIESLKASLRDLTSSRRELLSNLDEKELRFKRELRGIQENKSDEIRKLRKTFEENIETLEENRKELEKTIKELKTNKTAEQIEIAHQEELQELKEKLDAVETFNSEILSRDTSPIKLMKYLREYRIGKAFRETHRWASNLWSNTTTAIERVQLFAKIMNSIGKKPETNNKTVTPNNYYDETVWNGSYYEIVRRYC